MQGKASNPMIMNLIFLATGIALLVWSADRFVEGSATVAKRAGMSPLVIGMVIVGFGTSTPELIVSVLASAEGNPGIALGNAYGSNIANIALILGIASLIRPLTVRSSILKKELPILTVITMLSVLLMLDRKLGRTDGIVLLVAFCILMWWTIREGRGHVTDPLGEQFAQESEARRMGLGKAIFRIVLSLAILIASSRLLVYAAVSIATALGMSDMVIGLTVVAVGTSLPELASSIIAAHKGEHDIALGNVLGSNLFNTLAVAGLATTIRPTALEDAMLYRDMSFMGLLTISLFIFGYGFRGRKGRLNRFEGAFLLIAYFIYTFILIRSTIR